MSSSITNVRLLGGDGAPLTEVCGEVPFRVEVSAARGPGEPPPTVDVTFAGEDGTTRTLRLRWDGGVRGAVRYVSEPVTLSGGGTGAGTTTVGGLAVSRGDLTPMRVQNGVRFTVGVGGVTTGFRSWHSIPEAGIGLTEEAIDAIELVLRAGLEHLGLVPASDMAEVERSLRDRLNVVQQARGMLADPSALAHVRAAQGAAYVSWLLGHSLDPNNAPYRHDVLVRNLREAAANAHLDALGAAVRGLAGLAKALYQGTVGATVAAPIWVLRTHTTITGERASGLDRWLAAVELVVAGSSLTAGTLHAQDGLVARTPATDRSAKAPGVLVHEPDASGLRPPLSAQVIRTPTKDTLARKPIQAVVEEGKAVGVQATPVVRRPGGTRVTEILETGMLPDELRTFRRVLDEVAERVGADGDPRFPFGVEVDTRPTNVGSGELRAAGHPGKHEKLKMKTNEGADHALGLAPASERGKVAVHAPDEIARSVGVDHPDQVVKRGVDREGVEVWITQDPPGGVRPPGWDRAAQRIAEAYDEADAIHHLVEDGLIEVTPQGTVIDRGLTNYVVRDGVLVRRPESECRPGGTGLAFVGDIDLLRIVDRRGVPLPAALAEEVAEALRQAFVVEHGALLSWLPKLLKDIRIKRAIVEKHQGVVDPETGHVIPHDQPARVDPGSGVGLPPVRAEGAVRIGGTGVPPRVAYLEPVTGNKGVPVREPDPVRAPAPPPAPKPPTMPGPVVPHGEEGGAPPAGATDPGTTPAPPRHWRELVDPTGHVTFVPDGEPTAAPAPWPAPPAEKPPTHWREIIDPTGHVIFVPDGDPPAAPAPWPAPPPEKPRTRWREITDPTGHVSFVPEAATAPRPGGRGWAPVLHSALLLAGAGCLLLRADATPANLAVPASPVVEQVTRGLPLPTGAVTGPAGHRVVLVVRVLDDRTGRGVPGAAVTVTTPGGAHGSRTTGSGGTVRVDVGHGDRTPVGTYVVAVVAPAGARVSGARGAAPTANGCAITVGEETDQVDVAVLVHLPETAARPERRPRATTPRAAPPVKPAAPGPEPVEDGSVEIIEGGPSEPATDSETVAPGTTQPPSPDVSEPVGAEPGSPSEEDRG